MINLLNFKKYSKHSHPEKFAKSVVNVVKEMSSIQKHNRRKHTVWNKIKSYILLHTSTSHNLSVCKGHNVSVKSVSSVHLGASLSCLSPPRQKLVHRLPPFPLKFGIATISADLRLSNLAMSTDLLLSTTLNLTVPCW